MASVTYKSKKDTWLIVVISPERRDQFLADLENRRSRLAREAQST